MFTMHVLSLWLKQQYLSALLTSNWHFWQMAQMSDKCLWCKTEKAQISGQMQIICTDWQHWVWVWQSMTVCVSVWQFVTVCDSSWQCVTECDRAWQSVTVWQSVRGCDTNNTCKKMSYISLGVLLFSSIPVIPAIFCNITTIKNIAYHTKNWLQYRYLEKTCDTCSSVYTAISVSHGWFEVQFF